MTDSNTPPPTCPTCYSHDRNERNAVGEAPHGVDPGEHVARAGGRHPGIAGEVDVHGPIRFRHDGARAFEHDHGVGDAG